MLDQVCPTSIAWGVGDGGDVQAYYYGMSAWVWECARWCVRLVLDVWIYHI